MIDLSPQCYITGFVEIGKTGFGEEDFLGFFTMYVYGGHLGHVTKIIIIFLFISLYLKAIIQDLVKLAQWFLRKAGLILI